MDIEEKIQYNVSIGAMTTYQIGGHANFYIEVKTKEELVAAIDWAKKNDKEFLILGGGSNVLVNSNKIDSLVVKLANNEIIIRGIRLECGAAANLQKATRQSFGQGLTGLEWAIGIPGSVGGAVRGNAGAFGSSIEENIETIEVYNVQKGIFDLYSRNISGFSYRNSIFKESPNLIIWSVALRLNEGNKEEIDALAEENMKRRVCSQPKYPSAGCVFKNIMFEDLKESNSRLADMAEQKGVVKGGKVGAGWVISQLGVQGKKIGEAKISLEHANFIVNTGGASSDDVVMLISYIKQQVRDKYGVQLQEEIQYFGF